MSLNLASEVLVLAPLAYLPLLVVTSWSAASIFVKKKFSIGALVLNGFFLIACALPGLYTMFERAQGLVPYPPATNISSGTILSGAFVTTASYVFAVMGYRMLARSNGTREWATPSRGLDASARYACTAAFCIGTFSLLIYAREYGGFSSALLSAAHIRSGYGELSGDGRGLTFVKTFLPIVMFPVLGAIYDWNSTKSKKAAMTLAIVCIVGLACLSLLGSRTRLLIYLLGVLIFFRAISSGSLKFGLKKSLAATPILALALYILVYGKDVYSVLAQGEAWGGGRVTSGNFLESLVGYYTHRIYSLEVAILHGYNGSYDFFREFVLVPAYLIPERITGIVKPESISYYNTWALTSIWDSTVPPGVVAYGVYAFNIPGVIIISLIFGLGFGLFDRKTLSRGPLWMILTIPASFAWALYYGSGDMRVMTTGFTHVLLFWLIWEFFKLLTKLRGRRGLTH